MVLFKKLLAKILKWIVDISTIQTWGHSDFTYGTGFTYYGGAGSSAEPRAVKYGRTVNLAGAFKPTAQQSTGTLLLGYVPSGCEPAYNDLRFVQQGSYQNKFNLLLRTDGRMQLQNYGVTSATTIPKDAWLNITATYLSKN